MAYLGSMFFLSELNLHSSWISWLWEGKTRKMRCYPPNFCYSTWKLEEREEHIEMWSN
jgi:hypothetical protein